MTLCTALGAGFAMQVIGGASTAPAASVLRIQSLYLTAIFLNLSVQTTLLALRMHREMLISALAALGTVLVLLAVLVPTHAAHGAAVAVVVSEFVLALVEAVLLMRAHPRLRPELRVVPRVAVAAAAAVGVALVVDGHDVVRVIVATVVYAAVLAVLRAVPPELLHALRRTSAPAPESAS
jgi:O-antigen/teichoic acid export membrane protein